MKFLLLFLLLIAGVAQAGQDDDFLAARDAFRVGDARKLATFARRLEHSPLEVYVAYYQLRMGLADADPATVRAYLARPEDTPMIDRMRAEWLVMLGKSQQWALFDAEYPRLLADDPQLACYALQSRGRSEPQAVLAEARRLWFTAKVLPGSCATLFDAAITAGVISQPDIGQRLRLVLEAGNVALANEVAVYLSGSFAVSPAALGRAMDNPARYLEGVSFDKANAGQRTVVLFALQRLARLSPDSAAQQWARLAGSFPMTDQQYFLGWLGFEAARKHDPRALQWYRAAGDVALNEQQAAWRVRAALRAQDWPEVLRTVNSMNERQRNEPAWLYWKGRALQAQGQRAEADKLFAPLSAGYDFYALLAGDELGAVMGNAQPAYQPGRRELTAIENQPGIQRALALYRMDLRTDGYREWAWAVRNFNDRELLAAAEIARRNEIYDRAIYTAEKTVHVHDFSLRYLAPYRAALSEHIRDNGLEEAWVYGLMRQESRFVTAAKSNVGAAGLMQVMPATARWLARKMGWRDYRESMIHQLDANLKLGTFYMKSVLANLDDSPVLATAGYNAGPSRARRWRADAPLEGAIYVETIQFEETRDYVKKVMCNTVHYAQQFGAPTRSLKQRLGVIAGKTADVGNQAVGEVP